VRVLSDHQSDGACRRLYSRRHVQAKLDKLDAVLALASTSVQDAALFAEMLSLPNDGRYPAFDLAPEQRAQLTSRGSGTLQAGANDLRGCALVRPHEPGGFWQGRGPN
jgi:hypothetical protein